MARGVATVAPEETVRAVADRFACGDPRMARHRALPILDRDARLVGIVTQGDILRALEADPQGATPVLDAGTLSLVVAHPDESAFDALTKMLLNNVGRLPVVSRADAQHMVGYVNRTSLMASWGRHLEEESLRETGWLNLLRPGGKRTAAARELIGYVTDIDEVGIKLRVEDSTEELALDAPVLGIRIGDYIRVSFHEEAGRRVVRRIEELLSRQ
jgi:CBS domain-containing protein